MTIATATVATTVTVIVALNVARTFSRVTLKALAAVIRVFMNAARVALFVGTVLSIKINHVINRVYHKPGSLKVIMSKPIKVHSAT